MRTTLELDDDMPVIRVPAGTAAITPQMVARALDEDTDPGVLRCR